MSVSKSTFPTGLIYADVKPAFRKMETPIRQTLDRSAFSQNGVKSIKDLHVTKCIRSLRNLFQNSNAVFRKFLVPSIVWSLWQKQSESLLKHFSKVFDCIYHDSKVLYKQFWKKKKTYFIHLYFRGRKIKSQKKYLWQYVWQGSFWRNQGSVVSHMRNIWILWSL